MPTSRSAREAFDAISFRLAPNPDGHTSSRARLGAGALVRVGVLSILQVLREEPFAPSLSAVPHAPAPTAERTELARPDVGEPLALLLRHARESCSFPLEGCEILVGRFDGKLKDHEVREAERLLHLPDASVSRRRRSIQPVGGRGVAPDLSTERRRPFVGELPVAEVELMPHAVLRLGPHADGPTIDLVTVPALTPAAQAKLLRALQDGELRRVDVRVVATAA